MKNKLVLLLLAVISAAAMLMGCSDDDENDKDIPSLPFPSVSDEETEEKETQPQETDAPAVQVESPVPAEEAHALIAEKLGMAEDSIRLTGSEYFKYNDATYIFYFEFDDNTTYAPVAITISPIRMYARDFLFIVRKNFGPAIYPTAVTNSAVPMFENTLKPAGS